VLYTVKKLHNSCIFLPKPSETGKLLCWQGNFWCPPQGRIFLVFEEVKVFSYCRGNFFLDVECYISLFLLFPDYIYRKITGRFLAGHRSSGQSGHKIWPLRKKFVPFC
jgi:hypothetical protein